MKLFTEDRIDRFGELLLVMLKDENLIPKDQDLGASREDLGSHSNRKGAASFLCGLSVCLSAVNIYLRAGWSVGAVQDRYIFAGPGGDQIVGRCVAGLPINNRDFTTLPPHFTRAGLEIVRDIGFEQFVEGYNEIPGGFQRVIVMLLASVIFHFNFLRSELQPDHPLWSQLMFTKTVTTKKSGVTYRNVYEALKGHVICGRDRCPDTGMQATGIPTHILIANQVSDLRDIVENKFSELSSTVTSLAESMNRRMDALECAMPNELFKMLMEHFKVDGVAPVNMADIQQLLDVRQQEILDRLEQILKQNAVGNGPVVSQTSLTCNGSSSVSPRDSGVIYKYFSWGGKLRRLVPQGFIFPKVDVKTMWNLWYFGHSGQQIHPYKELCNFLDDLSSNRDKERYSRAKKVMSFLEDEMLTQNLLPDSVESIGALKAEEADWVFWHAYEDVVL